MEDIRHRAAGADIYGTDGNSCRVFGGVSANSLALDRNRPLMAPLAGVTDGAFRVMCAEGGAALTYTEMISAKGVLYDNVRTLELFQLRPEETSVGVQFFGNEPETVARAVRYACERLGSRLAIVDINMGCPVRKVVSNGEGCALMRDIPLACAVIGAAKRVAEEYGVPLSVKFRKGFAEENAAEFAVAAQDAGADVLTVHGRTREQMYEGKADLDTIARVKAAVSVPVIGNGDVADGPSARYMLEHTGCDALMIGRAALGDPTVFARIKAYLETGIEPTPPTAEQRVALALRHIALLAETKPERIAVCELRKHAAWYMKGVRGAAALRARLVTAGSIAELSELLISLVN